MKVAAAVCTDIDPVRAGATAGRQAAAGLGGEPADLAVVFASGARITKIAVSTPLQRRAFDLIGVPVPTELKAM